MIRSDRVDLAPITRHLRAMYSSRMLIAAVRQLNVFEELSAGPLLHGDLQRRIGLADRPAMVLFPALCAMGMLNRAASGELSLTELGRHLTRAAPSNMVGYVALEGTDPGVLEMAERLRNDGPLHSPDGVAYVKDGEAPSPMDDPSDARKLTLALAGRARHLSAIAAAALPRMEGHMLDVAGGTGLFAYEWLLANPSSTATVLDRPEVLKVAGEFLREMAGSGRPGAADLQDRVTLLPGNMLEDELPRANLLLAASLFHDWPTEICELLARRFAAALNPGGELWVHDAFLDDSLDGPLAVTDYSAQLFWVTKGRAYSRGEYRGWLEAAGLVPTDTSPATLLDYALISARKPT
ncbi:MAG: methyltransferase [Gemmatimonadetes bacterium]|nr:methyltransferase [Gemmatimonadota bacterium]